MMGRRVFAIVPAAGRSRRMGEPKLLLAWKGSTIIDCVLRAWCDSDVTRVIVVLRKDDQLLASACQQRPIEIVRPDRDPLDMKESIQVGLRHVANIYKPTGHDQWMVAPADLPGLKSELINQLIVQAKCRDRVTAPRFGGRQGHPVVLPWRLAEEVFTLSQNEGLDRILARQDINFVDLPAACRVADVDTPAEYERLRDA